MKRISFSYGVRPAQVIQVLLLSLLLSLLAACSPDSLTNSANYTGDTKASANVIYGADGRQDVYEVSDPRLRQLADSTVALVRTTDLSSSGVITSLLGKNYGSDLNLCSTEKFREQDTAAFCSGSLVGPDTVLTAGHCIQAIADCTSTSLVFGFAVKAPGVLPKTVSSSEVYRCKEIIKTLRIDSGADFAIIKLDRVVTGHAVLGVRATGDVDAAASLVVIGHPVGLPTKITTGGVVRSLANAGYFTTNLDTYGGNSGSAVFNRETGLIEGILVRGEQDFESKGGCVVSKACAEGACRGEDVTRISEVRPFLPVVSTPPPPVTPPVINPPTPPVTPPAPAIETFTSNSVIAIPDNNQSGINSELAVSSSPKGRKVLVNVNITHTYIGDLTIKLIAADGKSVVLQQRLGGSARNLNKSYDVTASLGQVASTGKYKLVVQDLAARDIGNLVSWSITFK